MAEQVLKAGAALDVLSGPEYRQGVDRLAAEMRREAVPTRDWHPCNLVATTAAGLLGGGYSGPGALLYQCPVGYFADLHRAMVELQGYPDPAAPLTTGSWKLYRGTASPYGHIGWFAPTGGSVSPVAYVEGEGCPRLGPGEQLLIAGAGLPASVDVFVSILVRLWRSGSGPTRSIVAEG